MTTKPYGLICPISHACDVLEPRWTIPILTEMWNGSTRFNDIRRGIGSISPALLTKRLRELEDLGLILRIENPGNGQVDYVRTQRAIELEPALNELGKWAQCNIEARAALDATNVSALMWGMRRYVMPEHLPDRQCVIQFRFADEGLEYDTYWVLVRPGLPVEICSAIPGFEVDLFVETDLVSLCSIILGRTTIARELETGRLFMSGDSLMAHTMDKWLYIRTAESPDEVRELEALAQ